MKKTLVKTIENALDFGFNNHIPLTADFLADKLMSAGVNMEIENRKNGFNDRDFINYFIYEKPAKNENPHRLLSEMLETILTYAHKTQHISKDQFIYFLYDILPNLDFGEIAQFANDEILTAHGRGEKYYYLSGKEEETKC